MENITSELDKVISYTLGRDIITEEDIECSVYYPGDEQNI